MYDLHEMRSEYNPVKEETRTKWVSTRHQNLPYSMIKGLKAKQEALKHAPGTFFLPVKNGKNPIEMLLKRKKKYVQSKMDL